MSVLERIAYYQNQRDEAPNQELARELANQRDIAGIQEIALNLWNSNTNVQSDCLKVLYEVGYLSPELILPYVNDFLRLLRSGNNRLVWGAMIALSTVAELCADALVPHIAEIQRAVETGSVITQDNGVKVLSAIAAHSDENRLKLLPYLLEHLRTCRPKDVPQHAESILPAIGERGKDAFVSILQQRMEDLRGAQLTRVKKVIRTAQALGAGD